MLRKLIMLNILCAALATPALAGFRVSVGGGLGQTQASNEITETEGPFTSLVTMDYVITSRQMVGLEHLRSVSLSPMSTSMSFTGIYYSYYMNAIPTPYVSVDKIDSEEIVFRDIGYFVGMGIGMAQSNNLPDADGKTSNSAGFYISPRVGGDFQLTRSLGARGELIIANTTMGTGTIMSTSLVGSLFWCF